MHFRVQQPQNFSVASQQAAHPKMRFALLKLSALLFLFHLSTAKVRCHRSTQINERALPPTNCLGDYCALDVVSIATPSRMSLKNDNWYIRYCVTGPKPITSNRFQLVTFAGDSIQCEIKNNTNPYDPKAAYIYTCVCQGVDFCL